MSTGGLPSLESEQILQLRITGGVLGFGALAFAVVVTALPFIGGGPVNPEGPADASTVQLLSIVNGVLFASTLAMARLVPPLIAQRLRLADPLREGDLRLEQRRRGGRADAQLLRCLPQK